MEEGCFFCLEGWPFGFEADHSRFRVMRQQFHRIVRHSRSVYWDDWFCRVQSLSHRDPRFASAHIRRTFRSTAASLLIYATCSGRADHRSVLSQSDALTQWRTHFASTATSSKFRTTSSFLSPAVTLHSLLSTTPASSTLLFHTVNLSLRCQSAMRLCQVLTSFHSLSSRCTSRGGATCSFLSLTSSCTSFHPLGNLALRFPCSKGTEIQHHTTLIGQFLSPLVRSRCLST